MARNFDSPWLGIGVAGAICLEFVNTLDWRLRARPTEYLTGYDELLRWARGAGCLTPAAARDLQVWAADHPDPARRSLRRAIALREALAELFSALQAAQPLPPAALAHLESCCRPALRARVLRPQEKGAGWTWEGSPGPDRPLWVVALDAAALLGSDRCGQLRQCGDAECGWFFLDGSRNRSRRWCSMESCGNRNKARRFYRRRRGD